MVEVDTEVSVSTEVAVSFQRVKNSYFSVQKRLTCHSKRIGLLPQISCLDYSHSGNRCARNRPWRDGSCRSSKDGSKDDDRFCLSDSCSLNMFDPRSGRFRQAYLSGCGQDDGVKESKGGQNSHTQRVLHRENLAVVLRENL